LTPVLKFMHIGRVGDHDNYAETFFPWLSILFWVFNYLWEMLSNVFGYLSWVEWSTCCGIF